MNKLTSATLRNIYADFSRKKFFIAFAIIAVVCFINYYIGFHFWKKNSCYFFSLFWYYCLFFLFLYAGIALETNRFWQSKPVLFVLFLSPLIFALKVSFPVRLLFQNILPPQYFKAFYQPVSWVAGVFIISFCLMCLNYYYHRSWSLFGVKKTTSFLSYFLLVLYMLPLLVFASFQKDFLLVYPRAQIITASLGNNASFLHYVLFEIAYMCDFFSIELFFRGFLIILLGKILGKQCILPIALFYFSIHLGKPMLEAISSFFGGYILGIISYKTKSIWGGWLVHVSIALLMELLGFLI